MEVTRYLFQSPYTSQVQVGKPEKDATPANAQNSATPNPVQAVSSVDSAVKKETTTNQAADKLLDIYT